MSDSSDMIDLVSSEEITHSFEATAPSESSSSSEEKIDRYAFRRNAFFEHDGLDESSGADEVRHEHDETRHGGGDSQQYDEDGFEIYDPTKFNDVVLVPPTRVLLNTNNNHNAANAIPNAASASVARPVSNLNNAAISNKSQPNNNNSPNNSQNAGVKRTGSLDNWIVSPAPAPSPSGQGSLSRSGSFQMRLAEDEEYARKLQAELDAEPVERELFECPVCLEEKPLDSKFLYQKCEHEQCRECAAEFFQRQIELGLEIKCILCQSPVSVLDLELVLDVPEVKKYRKLIGEKDVDDHPLQAASTPPPPVVVKAQKKRTIKKVPIVAPPKKKVVTAKQAVAPKHYSPPPVPPPTPVNNGLKVMMHNQVLKQSSPSKLSSSGSAVSDNHLSHSGSKQSAAVVVPPKSVDDLVSLQQQRILNNSNTNNNNAISNNNSSNINHNYHPYPALPVQQLPKKLDALPSHHGKVSSLSASKQKEKSEGWMANDSDYHPHHENNDNAADVGAGPVTRASARKRKAATLDG